MSETNTRTVVTRIQNKYDPASEWTANNPTLLTGEVGFESDTGKFKIGDGSTPWNSLQYAAAQSVNGDSLDTANDKIDKLRDDVDSVRYDFDNLELTYSNDTPIVTPVGSIREGATFNNVLIQDMLTMILYPYIDIVVQNPVTTAATGAYTIPNYPTLSSVSIYVKKNSATKLAFSLWDTTTNKQLGKTLSESDISGNQMTFADLNTVVDTDRTFKIKYTYNGEGGEAVGEKSLDVGKFSFTFTKPSTPTISSNLSKTSYYNGQTAGVTSLSANVASINSASAHGITKMELYRGNTLASTSTANPGQSYTFTVSDSITSDTTYKVKAYYKTRTATNTEYSDASVESSYSIKFSRKAASVSLAGVSGGTFSKLNPQSISNGTVKANFTKYSDSITSVKLFEGNNAKDEQTVSGHSGTTYSEAGGSATFSYSKTNTCTDFKLKAQVYNGTDVGESSSEISYTFYSPYCYGFVDESKSFADIDAAILKTLTSSQTKKTNITLSKLDAPKKFIYAVPTSGGTFTSAKDGANEENFGLFEKNSSGGYTKTITFADGSTQEYQILILKGASAAAVNLNFS